MSRVSTPHNLRSVERLSGSILAPRSYLPATLRFTLESRCSTEGTDGYQIVRRDFWKQTNDLGVVAAVVIAF